MTNHDLDLPFWEGFFASKSERPGAVWIDLRRDAAAPMVCSGCGHHCHQVHEAGTRIIRELPMFGLSVWLVCRSGAWVAVNAAIASNAFPGLIAIPE